MALRYAARAAWSASLARHWRPGWEAVDDAARDAVLDEGCPAANADGGASPKTRRGGRSQSRSRFKTKRGRNESSRRRHVGPCGPPARGRPRSGCPEMGSRGAEESPHWCNVFLAMPIGLRGIEDGIESTPMAANGDSRQRAFSSSGGGSCQIPVFVIGNTAAKSELRPRSFRPCSDWLDGWERWTGFGAHLLGFHLGRTADSWLSRSAPHGQRAPSLLVFGSRRWASMLGAHA